MFKLQQWIDGLSEHEHDRLNRTLLVLAGAASIPLSIYMIPYFAGAILLLTQ